MGRVFREAEAELDAVLRRYAGRPRAAFLRLMLMALEREQIVSLAYRQSVIAARLKRMPIPDGVRGLIEHAVVWVWKDEEMHTVYARGALMQMGRGSVRLRALVEQAGGAVAGWATGVLHHSSWHLAPVARAAASLVVLAGRAGGRMPPEVGKLLKFGPFRDFCLLNADLELASGLCWDTLIRLAAGQPDLGPETLVEFWRVVEDEDRHRRVFEAVAAALAADDRLADGAGYESLAGQIAAVGHSFLPRGLRTVAAGQPIGSGGRVWCREGAAGEDAVSALRHTLAACDLADRLRARAAAVGKPLAGMRVTIKGCFMLGTHRADPSPIVAPTLAEELARYFRGLGVGRVTLAEARYVYDRFYHNRGVADVARYFGFDSPLYDLADLSADQVPHAHARGLGSTSVGRAWAAADFRVSLAKLRSHPVEQVLLALGNLEGVGGRTDDHIFADRVADRPTALMALLDEFPPHYAVLDAYATAADGLAGMMGCGRPVAARRFYAGADVLAVDGVAARHVGVTDPAASGLLRAAGHWFGGWPAGVEVVGTDARIAGWRGPQATDLRALLSLLALPVYVWGSGRGSLFMPAMDEAAFPPKRAAGPVVRLGRRVTRAVLGLPSPGRR